MMNTSEFIKKEDGKIVIPVPKGIRYIGSWKDFNLSFFGPGPFIIDKQIPGCGFTEYCLTSKFENIVLTSPRKILLKNKENQHQGEVHYFKNDCDGSSDVDKDLNKQKKSEEEEVVTLNHDKLDKMEEDLEEYLSTRKGRPSKIIVTYDSFKHVKRMLIEKGLFSSYKIVVDEFQSIFVDSRFKATTEFEFLTELRGLSNQICFVSATPMMDQYLMQLDYFKGLPYYELNWEMRDSSRVMKPELKVRKIKSVNSEIKRIIKEYKDGKFAVLSDKDGNPVLSKEAVFYVNSVNNILTVIKSEGLKPEEVNILCSDTGDNKSKLSKKLGDRFKIGEVPLRGQPHKMFTFCTRTVYLGADFYSTNARTFILSDANIESLAVDISLDLPQIMGRQRLDENPWKNHAEFYFKNLGSGKELDKSEFDDLLKKKIKRTETLLEIVKDASGDREKIEALIDKIRTDILVSNYRKDYVSINDSYNGDSIPVFNQLVYISEQRAFDIQQTDYRDRFTVFNTIKSERGLRLDKMARYIDDLRKTKIEIEGKIVDYPLWKRLKDLCETKEFKEDEKKVIAHQVSEKFDKLYNLLGPEKCKAAGYNTTDLLKEIEFMLSKESVQSRFCSQFLVGNKYTNQDAKRRIKKIYEDLNFERTPKAVDLLDFFEVKKVQIMEDGKKVHGYEILGVKTV